LEIDFAAGRPDSWPQFGVPDTVLSEDYAGESHTGNQGERFQIAKQGGRFQIGNKKPGER